MCSSRTRSKSDIIDYKILNSTGEKVLKSKNSTQAESSSTENQNLDLISYVHEQSNLVNEIEDSFELSSLFSSLTLKEEIMAAEKEILQKQFLNSFYTTADVIADFLDENPVDEGLLIDDIDTQILQIDNLRTNLRGQLRDLKEFNDQKVEDDANNILKSIKEYIKISKEIRRKLREKSDTSILLKHEAENRSSEFVLNDIKSSLKFNEEVLKKDVSTISDDEIKKENTESPELEKRIQRISKQIEDVLKLPVYDQEVDEMLTEIKLRYEQLIPLKKTYLDKIKAELVKRDIVKNDLFKESLLNIKLSKFKGYSSQVDIYTFKRDFEYIHLTTTPTRYLADLLKNNYLENPALALVRAETSIDEIWKRLISAYGDTKMLLSNKLAEFNDMEALWKIKDPTKLVEGLSKIINAIKDILNLTKTHNIQMSLFYGDGIQRIYKLIGDARVTRWLTITCDLNLEGEKLWLQLISFLEKEVKIQQQKSHIDGISVDGVRQKQGENSRKDNYKRYGHSAHINSTIDSLACLICGATDHVATSGPGNSKLVQYFACQKFVNLTPAGRFLELRKKKFCFQCLYPGAGINTGKHKDGKCQHDFSCKHTDHQKYPIKKHVLVCEEHKATPENQQLLEHFKSRCIVKRTELPTFAKEIKLVFLSHCNQLTNANQNNGSSNSLNPIYDSSQSVHLSTKKGKASCQGEDASDYSAVYLLQTVKIDNQNYTILFDNGCGDFVSRFKAIQKLKYRSTQELAGPIQIVGVGAALSTSDHGIYSVRIPLQNGGEAKLSGVCLDQITTTFPRYPLHGEVINDIVNAYCKAGYDRSTLPTVEKSVGGDIDFLIGVKYLRYHPEKVFQLASGLAIYTSMFENADGGTGVIGGPHKVFSNIESHHYSNTPNITTFLSQQYSHFKNGYQVNPDLSFIKFQNQKDSFNDSLSSIQDTESSSYICRAEKSFEIAENSGTEITFRCIKCRSCKDCRDHEHIESISIKEEMEQDLINKSVSVDINNQLTVASLPLLYDPVSRLAPNKNRARQVYNQQVKKLSQNPKDRDDVIQSEQKLHSLNHVDYVQNLTPAQQEMLKSHTIQNYIPWRAVWNGNSVTTPCRLVFDASQQTASGTSLNEILAKGKNNMNKLVEIFIRWSIYKIGFHTDIKKMYNTVKLKEDDWCLQRYLWEENLDPTKEPKEKVIRTLIYGVKSSGNQAERGLRETARLSKDFYPDVNRIVQQDIYVDDCLSGESSQELALKRADEIELVLNRGGFSLKGFTMSGKKPLSSLSSEDGESIKVAGLRWYPEADKISLDVSELNFAKKSRGKKSTDSRNVIPALLTRRHCVAKIAEIFDLTGKVTPLTASFKIDLHDLVLRNLDWDDKIPDELRPLWESNFKLMQEINSITFNRAIVPDDAESLDIETIDTGDASKSLACVAIYARFKKKDGTFSCQLVFARSKLIPEGMSQPRAEMFAATVNTHTGEVVRKSFQSHWKSSIKLTDSQVVLYWINNDDQPIKQWVRNRVIEVRRFTTLDQWKYVRSADMIADIGTRKGATLKDINQSSTWINGFTWMSQDKEKFPIKSIEEIRLNATEMSSIKNEIMNQFKNSFSTPESSETISNSSLLAKSTKNSSIPESVQVRYQYSNYIIDPNRHRFSSIIRIVAYVKRFINNLKSKLIQNRQFNSVLADQEIKEAENYFYQIATKEIKEFAKESSYQKISIEREGILYYTGRILPSQDISTVGCMTSLMKDLVSRSFCVPLIDKYSPLAYAIVNEVHWFDPIAKHSGIELVHRQVLQKGYIIEGRELVKKFRKKCERCRYLMKRTVDVTMGPISKYNMTIAPAFYITQVDLAGPFKAYSPHNKRTTIKVWFAVYCCTTTSSTIIKVMDDYSSTAFLQSFIRFSCEVGYPKVMLIDEGSQIVKSCETMEVNFKDLQGKLSKNWRIEFEVCPVGGHNFHGKVERKIQQIKMSLIKNVQNERLSILQWETIASEIANTINDLPLALGNLVSNFDNMDLLTPNRLRLGRNNNRSPVHPLYITNNKDSIMKDNQRIFNTWFENWLIFHVPKLMVQPKWYHNDENLKEGDIVLFLKNESVLCSTYQYGIIKEVKISADNKVRSAIVQYRNHNENVNRETSRAVRQLVVIHHIDEINLIKELGEVANYADIKRTLDEKSKSNF